MKKGVTDKLDPCPASAPSLTLLYAADIILRQHKIASLLMLILTMPMLVACKSHDAAESRTSDSDSFDARPAAGVALDPGTCKVAAQVLAIDSSRHSRRSDDPCAKAPCRATLKIGETLGFGMAFPAVLGAGDEIEVTFAFTTAPTEQLFPRLNRHYPGIQPGDRLVAILHASPQAHSNEPAYTIYEYQLR